MEDLDQALSFAHYQSTLTQQRKLILQKFQEATVMAYNGGLFKLSLEFIASIKSAQFDWLLDSNGTPIKITDYDTFIIEAETLYQKAIEEYGTEFSTLRLKRNVKSLVGL
jgi:hypothetical protein